MVLAESHLSLFYYIAESLTFFGSVRFCARLSERSDETRAPRIAHTAMRQARNIRAEANTGERDP